MNEYFVVVRPIRDDDELTCEKCGEKYTMGEFRHWRYVAFSLLCVSCDVEATHKMLHEKYGINFEEQA